MSRIVPGRRASANASWRRLHQAAQAETSQSAKPHSRLVIPGSMMSVLEPALRSHSMRRSVRPSKLWVNMAQAARSGAGSGGMRRMISLRTGGRVGRNRSMGMVIWPTDSTSQISPIASSASAEPHPGSRVRPNSHPTRMA